MNFGSNRARISNSSTQVADALRDEILQGKLQPAEKLNQSAIADQFGVSKIPVREALHRLEADGLITFQPNGNATVSSLSIEELDQIYAMRIVLEKLLLEAAFPNMQEVDLIKAENALRLIDHEQNVYQWMMLDWTFHHALYRPSQMALVIQNADKLYINAVRYFVAHKLLSYQARSQVEHRVILEACQQKDVTQALEALENHLRASQQALIEFLKRE